MPQDLALYEDLSARENLKLFAALYGIRGAQCKERCDWVLALVNLADRAGETVSTFLGGMKRRLNIAAALMHDPHLLILDEPTVGVDPQSRNAIFDRLEQLKALGRSLIYTSHNMEEVERLADHIVIIDHGKVLADGSPADLFRRLPAQAALRIELCEPAPLLLREGIRALHGVSSVEGEAGLLDIALARSEGALPVKGYLERQGCRALHFATARTKLEDVFLALVQQDGGEAGAKIAAALKGDATLRITQMDAAQARRAVAKGAQKAAIVIPAGFGEAAGSAMFGVGPKPAVEVLYDPSQQAVLSMVKGMLSQHLIQVVSAEMFGGTTGKAFTDKSIKQLEQSGAPIRSRWQCATCLAA